MEPQASRHDQTSPLRQRRARARAAEVMAEYYKANKAKLPSGISSHRELIIDLLVSGLSVEDSFQAAIEADDSLVF